MKEWVEVKIPEEKKPEYPYCGECPECGKDIVRKRIPCPDGREGCLVNHFGCQCIGCGKIWTQKKKRRSN